MRKAYNNTVIHLEKYVVYSTLHVCIMTDLLTQHFFCLAVIYIYSSVVRDYLDSEEESMCIHTSREICTVVYTLHVCIS